MMHAHNIGFLTGMAYTLLALCFPLVFFVGEPLVVVLFGFALSVLIDRLQSNMARIAEGEGAGS